MHNHSLHQDNREPQNSATPSGSTDRRALLAGIAGIGAGAFLAGKAHAGPLNTPPGPIAPTPGPEPRIPVNADNTPGTSTALFRISQPGSYYLTGNITGVTGKHGIEIAASGVTLDLNGFDLVGVPGMGVFAGVTARASNLNNIEVRNGSVRNWGDKGVDLGTFNTINCRIERIRASGNIGEGMRAGTRSTVSECTAYDNGDTGIRAGSGSTVIACTASGNTENGTFVGSGCTVSACTAFSNPGDGIFANNGCTISGCTVYANSFRGIACNGSTVCGCTASFNNGNGISADSDCLIIGNNCDSNGISGDAAGIRVNFSNNRIDGNNCTDCDRGIDVGSAGNIIIRNTCAGNATNYAIAANNRYGPIVNITATGTAAVNGKFAAGTLTSTDPHANFAY